jgi:hypothetical protein
VELRLELHKFILEAFSVLYVNIKLKNSTLNFKSVVFYFFTYMTVNNEKKTNMDKIRLELVLLERRFFLPADSASVLLSHPNGGCTDLEHFMI